MPEPAARMIQNRWQYVLFVVLSAVLPLVGIIAAVALAVRREFDTAAVMLAAAVLGAIIWSIIL